MAEITLSNPSHSDVAGHGQAYTVLPDNCVAITPSNDNHFSHPVTVEIGVAGDVAFIPWARRGEAAPTPVVRSYEAGDIIKCRVWKVRATGTTATGLVGYY